MQRGEMRRKIAGRKGGAVSSFAGPISEQKRMRQGNNSTRGLTRQAGISRDMMEEASRHG